MCTVWPEVGGCAEAVAVKSVLPTPGASARTVFVPRALPSVSEVLAWPLLSVTALTGETGDDALTPRAAAAWLVHRLAVDSGGTAMVSPADAGFLLFGATLNAS